MPRPLGPHRPGDPAHTTLTGASERLLDEVGGAIAPGELRLMVDDAIAPEVMTGERVDTLMPASHVFGVGDHTPYGPVASTGHRGLVAFTERRLIAAFSFGIIRLRRFVEVFALDGEAEFQTRTPIVEGRPVRMFEIANRQGWHRIFLPDDAELSVALVAAWDHRMAARLVGATRPRWDGDDLVGWESGNATIPTRRPPIPDESTTDHGPVDDDETEPSGPLPRPDLTPAMRWWDR